MRYATARRRVRCLSNCSASQSWSFIGPALPLLRDRPDPNCAAQASRRNSRGYPNGRVEILRFEREVPADSSAYVDEGALCCERLAVLHAHGGCVLRKSERQARRNAG